MRSKTGSRSLVLLAAATGTLCAALAPAAHASFGVQASRWEAGTCTTETCTYASVEGNHAEAFTQSAGHPPYGLTTFELNHKKGLLGEEPEGTPLERVRVDVPPGLAADPEALEQCSLAAFNKNECSEAEGHNTRVGTNELTVLVKALGSNLTVSAPVYNLQPAPGLALEFGIHVEALGGVINEHVLLEGHVSWHTEAPQQAQGIATGDYHEYFEIAGIEQENPVLKSKLIFFGTSGFKSPHASGNFLTLPTSCSSTTVSHVEVESQGGEISRAKTETPVGVEGCERDPFKPTAEVTPQDAQADAPDGITAEVKVPQHAGAEEINTADIKEARVMLPEGLTLNAAAAHGLETCSPAQIAIGTEKPVSCPSGSQLGTVSIETDLPPHSLSGHVYLGNPSGGAIAGPPLTIYLDAEAPQYGVAVRLQGTVSLNAQTGRVQALFGENPQLPFSSLSLTLNGGARAPLANPLQCGAANVESFFSPYTGLAGALSSTPFGTTGCSSPLPFSWTQSTAGQPASAGAFGATSYTLALARADGEQYVSSVAVSLPPGLVGAIASVPLCGEPQASAEAGCPASSQIGIATVTVGAGPEPYSFSGPVFLTGPYGGGPFGLAVDVPAVAGPFNFGTVVARAAITIDPYTGRVSVGASVPTIRNGVPLRVRSITVTANRPAFLYNPTSCAPLSTDTTLSSTLGAGATLSSPFQVANCAALAFTPTFTAASSSKTSKANGAALSVGVTEPPHQANIRSVSASLPLQLPTRLSTLQQACPQTTYAANPLYCPLGSRVGGATATTPVLPGTLSGPAYLVSHGGAAFPDLDLLLEGDGVRVILVGNTDIKGGVTTSTFAALPDVPLSSFALMLPTGPHSALSAYGSLCAQALVMPTTITAQSGAQVHENTVISVKGCEAAFIGARRVFRIVKRAISGHTLLLKVQTYVAGRLSAKGSYLNGAARTLRGAATVTLRLSLSGAGLRRLHRHRPLRINVRVTLTPHRRHQHSASATSTVAFRR